MPTTAGEALYAVLNAHEATAALIGAGEAMRLYPKEAPQGTPLPFMVYDVLGGGSQSTHGEGGEDGRLDDVQVQLSAFAESQLLANQLLHVARKAIEAPEAGLSAICTRPEQDLPRAEEADSYGSSADFLLWNDPDSE